MVRNRFKAFKKKYIGHKIESFLLKAEVTVWVFKNKAKCFVGCNSRLRKLGSNRVFFKKFLLTNY